MLRTKLLFLLTVVGVLLLAHAQPVGAEPAEKPPSAAEVSAALESGEVARIVAVLGRVQRAGAKAKKLVPLVNGLLARGANVTILRAGIRAAKALGDSSSSPLLARYCRHRSAPLRQEAVRAVITTGGAAAIRALRGVLRARDPQARRIAASGLGTLGAVGALEDLFKALDHGVAEAAGSIGQLCPPKDCERFARLTGKQPLVIMTSGFDAILFRSAKEIPDDTKIRIIGRLRELGTRDAGKYLLDVYDRWPEKGSKRVKQSLSSALKALGLRPQGRGKR